MTGGQVMKRIPRIKFPQRRPNPPGTVSQPTSTSAAPPVQTFFSNSKVSTSTGGKASLQPKRTAVSQEEIEAILESIKYRSEEQIAADENVLQLGGCF